MSKRVAAYLELGKTYLVLDLDEQLREIGRSVVERHELPQAVATKCDSYQPHDFREVEIPRPSHPKARDAAIKTFDHWSKITTKEEAFDHAIAEYMTSRGIVAADLLAKHGGGQ
ncbi:hypothetical protein HFO15_19565 [Rhizobium laguerreae]|uniref:hypothetical protein n=1 Tax=Rhizobium laguerreae TaxID=1076926 RepID=UPI001C90CCA0|nr:hypothetical protein [Rhizobium laguerreae]MBY3263827.1 hypothetical protein [Rhizobium laguerreae]